MCAPVSYWRTRGVRTRDETDEGKHEAELSAAPALLRTVPLAGRVVAGDAISCQHALCAQIRRAGGRFLFAVMADQPDLATDVALLCDQPPPGAVLATVHSHGRHGRHHARTTLRASSALTPYLAEAGGSQLQQRLRVAHIAMEYGVQTRAVRVLRDRPDRHPRILPDVRRGDLGQQRWYAAPALLP